MRLSLQTAVGSMRLIARGAPGMAIDKLGVTEDDLALTTGDVPWTTSDRNRVRKTLDSFIYGVIEDLGLPRFELPAEYIAAVISTFVAPVNYFPACSWITARMSNEELSTGIKGTTPQGFERVTPEQLFAIVVQLVNEADKTAAAYAAKTQAVITRLAISGGGE